MRHQRNHVELAVPAMLALPSDLPPSHSRARATIPQTLEMDVDGGRRRSGRRRGLNEVDASQQLC